uniref:Uncharacterized protein n=1 Tax=Anguilla anguilla TaxID=7936 RepID=A0A0E9PXU6_ANGAN
MGLTVEGEASEKIRTYVREITDHFMQLLRRCRETTGHTTFPVLTLLHHFYCCSVEQGPEAKLVQKVE